MSLQSQINLRKVIFKAMCTVLVLGVSGSKGGEGDLYNIMSRTLFHPAACRPASVLCSSDFVRAELRDTITVIGLRKRVVFCGRVSTFVLFPPTGTAGLL